MIKANSVVFIDCAYAAVVRSNMKDFTCASCFKQSYNYADLKMRACSQCNVNFYCNRDCQKRDWKQHKFECKCLNAIKEETNDFYWLILRLIVRENAKLDKQSYEKFLKTNNFSTKPRSFGDLMTNLELNDENMKIEFSKCWNALSSWLQMVELDIESIVSREAAEKIYAKSVTNNFEIQDECYRVLGFGCYLNGSGLNHSCWPTTYYRFSGLNMILIAVEDIKPKDELTITYVDMLQLRQDRITHLKHQYHFVCKCKACQDDELEREMSQLYCEEDGCIGSVFKMTPPSDCYQCNTCSSIVLEDAMNMRLSIMKAKKYHIDQLIKKEEYDRAYELARFELEKFGVECQSGGLYQLSFAEQSFEAAIFMRDYGSAYAVCALRPETNCEGGDESSSWIHERLCRFLGGRHHPVAQHHAIKYQKLLKFC